VEFGCASFLNGRGRSPKIKMAAGGKAEPFLISGGGAESAIANWKLTIPLTTGGVASLPQHRNSLSNHYPQRLDFKSLVTIMAAF